MCQDGVGGQQAGDGYSEERHSDGEEGSERVVALIDHEELLLSI